MKLKNSHLVILVGMMILALGCDKGDFPFPPHENLPHVMLIHASPDAPAVDVYLDDALFAKSLEYPNNTRYTTLREGENAVYQRHAVSGGKGPQEVAA